MSKIIRLSVLITFLVFGCRQTYWIISRGGNLNLNTCNSSDVEIVTMEVFVNGESVLIQDHSNRNSLEYKGLALYKSTGIHEVKVVAAEHGISKTTEVNLWTVKWINIEFTNDESDPNKYDLQLSVESSP